MRFRTELANRAVALGGVVGLIAAGLSVAATTAVAQDKKAEQSAWVKLCEVAPMRSRGKDGKVVSTRKQVCLTHHERLDGNTGMVMVSAAVRQVEGSDKQSLMLMVPLGMSLQPGLRAAVYTPEQWAKAQKREKIDEKALKPMSLKYSLCHPAGCTAEIDATPELMERMRNGGGLMVLAINAVGQPIGFPVPLTGFETAHKGKPIDNKLYAAERGKLLQTIRARQRELVRQAREKRQQQQKKN